MYFVSADDAADSVLDAILPNFLSQAHYMHLRTVRLSKTKWGTLCEKIRENIKGPALKTFRHGIKLIDLYCVTKSF